MSTSVEQVEEFANSPVQACLDYARPMRPPLSLEIAAARGVAALSRRLGAGGGTTIPGKLLAELDRGAVAPLPARLTAGTAVLSATNGQTKTTAMAGESPPPRHPPPPKRRRAH